jgi:hypothetical protein
MGNYLPVEVDGWYGGWEAAGVAHEAQQFVPHPRALLSLCWVAELHGEAVRRRLWSGKVPTHAKLIGLLERTTPADQIESVCRQLRGRNAMWRPDPAIMD